MMATVHYKISMIQSRWSTWTTICGPPPPPSVHRMVDSLSSCTCMHALRQVPRQGDHAYLLCDATEMLHSAYKAEETNHNSGAT